MSESKAKRLRAAKAARDETVRAETKVYHELTAAMNRLYWAKRELRLAERAWVSVQGEWKRAAQRWTEAASVRDETIRELRALKEAEA